MTRRDLESLRDKFVGKFEYSEEEFQALKEQQRRAKQEEQNQLKEGLMKSILKAYYPETQAKERIENFKTELEHLESRNKE